MSELAVVEESSVSGLLANTAKRHPDRTALVSGANRLTYAELDVEVTRAARGLVDVGLEVGDRVALWMPNRVEWVVAFYAIARAGGVVVPINTALSVSEATYQVGQSQASVIVTCGQVRAKNYASDALAVSAATSSPIVLVVDDDQVDGTTSWADVVRRGSEASPDVSLPPTSEEEPVVILYTSGTTGSPKGAVHTSRFLTPLINAGRRLDMTPDDCVVLYLPLFHVYGLFAGLILMTSVGAKLVLMDRFEVVDSLNLMESERATIVYGVPTTYIDQLNELETCDRDFSRIRFAVTPFPLDLCQRVADRFGFCVNCFGMTETASIALLPKLTDDPLTAMSTVGGPLDGMEARIVDPETDRDVPAGTPGQLMLRGGLILKEYWNKPDETSAAFDSNGWYRTGDLAQFTADGNIQFVGRRGDSFRVGGESVDPVEIEMVLQELPGVERAAVVGVPDDRLGAVAHAWLLPRADASGRRIPIDEEAVLESVRARLARFKVPRKVWVVDAFPTTPSGKVQKFKLRDSLNDLSAE